METTSVETIRAPETEETSSVRRALLSVSNKSRIVPFARSLVEMNVEIVSTGGTAETLQNASVPFQSVEDVTGFPELLDGKVKTLHPAIHAGIMADRSSEADMLELKRHGIKPIDLVCVSFYPLPLGEKDIGGPALVSAAEKNGSQCVPVTHPEQYDGIIEELRSNNGQISRPMRLRLGGDAARYVAQYHGAIADTYELVR